VFSHSFAVTVYGIQTDIQSRYVSAYTDKTRTLYTAATRPDACIKSDDAAAVQLTKDIIAKEKNPWLQAKLLYEYLLKNFTLQDTLSSVVQEPDEIIQSGSGDAYDITVLYCTLLRCAGIPALPVGGILIDADLKSTAHWWCDFYIEKIGWIPVDVALGAGMEYKPFKERPNPADFYFGNLDAQHIAFSRGWNAVKPASLQNITVYRPKTYAMQSIWEEASSNTLRYSSFWSDVYISGVY
jgi:transglutaminase-like putative cysteine protease